MSDMQLMTKTSTIINALGGTVAVAKMFKINPTTVSYWKSHNYFPANSYLMLKDVLAKRRIQAPDRLWAMRRMDDR